MLLLRKLAAVRRAGKGPSPPRKGKARTRDFAPGIPSKEKKRPIPKVKEPKDWPFVGQVHRAERAGKHLDLRLSDGETAFSWAVRKGLPDKPGKRHIAVRQPDHDPKYMGFSGRIKSKYGRGKVEIGRKGLARVLSASPDKVTFAALDKKNPEKFTMVRAGRYGKDKWLVMNTTPTKKSRPDIPTSKEKFKSSSPADLPKFMGGDYVLSPKIDGGQVTVNLGDRPEVFSRRPGKSGDLIDHTFLTGLDKVKVPKDLRGTQFRAELFGQKGKKPIPLREVAGLMNSTPQAAIRKAKKSGIRLKVAPWKMLRFQGEDVSMLPYEQQQSLMKRIKKKLGSRISTPSSASTRASKERLARRIREGKHPQTDEGLVAWPKKGVLATPSKIPFRGHEQVYIRDVYPMKRKGKAVEAAGGFTYSLKPGGPVVGKVGTGFTEEKRREIWKARKKIKDVKAVIESSGKYPSGAHRAPSFVAFHL